MSTKAEFSALNDHLHRNLPSSMVSGLSSTLESGLDRVNWRNNLYFDLLKAIRDFTLDDGPKNSSDSDSN